MVKEISYHEFKISIMKRKQLVQALILLTVLFAGTVPVSGNPDPKPVVKPLKVLLFTGGHDFHEESFYDMVFSLPGVQVDTISQPVANQSLLSDTVYSYDAIVFYDMWQKITEAEKEAFVGLTGRGTGLVFLHHSLVSYQDWDLFTRVRGGKYREGHSTYKHDIVMDVKIVDPGHPVTNGLEAFIIHDEGYGNIEILPGVTPLLSTNHPDCSEIIGWTNKFNNSRIVYLLLGHDNNAYADENFRTLVRNAIGWTTESNP
jgi:uncharacterized protein